NLSCNSSASRHAERKLFSSQSTGLWIWYGALTEKAWSQEALDELSRLQRLESRCGGMLRGPQRCRFMPGADQGPVRRFSRDLSFEDLPGPKAAEVECRWNDCVGGLGLSASLSSTC